ncbi:uncharacterized protein [Dysidea avara]|uniref:uncharacterized protein n=1 Tax=Dysidea avara TaxID=196820 RepID=UPI0033278A40
MHDICLTNGLCQAVIIDSAEETSTCPEQSSAYPEQTSTNPEETSTYPEQTSTNPEETSTYPEQTSTYPEKTSTYPEQTSTNPEETNTYPEETSTYSEQTSTNPEHTSTYPEQTSTNPEGTSAYPEEITGTTPSNEDTVIMVDSGTQYSTFSGVQCSVKMCNKATTPDLPAYVHKSSQTVPIMSITPFRIEQIQDNNKLINFYTGFSTFLELSTCYHFLGAAKAVLSYDPSRVIEDAATSCGKGHGHILSPINEFFLTLCRLRQGFPEQDLAVRFQISQPSVSRILVTLINFLYVKFKEVPIWPCRKLVDEYMPACFHTMYPKTRCIIDATEIFIQMPSNPTAQQLTFSSYKNHNTLKVLIEITPSGAISFISDLYGGSISDKKIVVKSGFLKLLEAGDSIMADKGFTLEDILPPGVELNIPPMLNETGQLTENERMTTRRIASLRIHVERAIERIKNYEILHRMENNMHNSANQIFFACATLTNFLPPLVQ